MKLLKLKHDTSTSGATVIANNNKICCINIFIISYSIEVFSLTGDNS